MPQGCDVTQSEWFKTKGNKTDTQILLEKINTLEQRILRLENIVKDIRPCYNIDGDWMNPWQK